MLWAVMCLCFFEFLRSGKVVDPTQYLSFTDITPKSLSNPSFLSLNIKQYKRGSGVKIIVGHTEDLCPVSAVLAYMSLQGPGKSPLFTSKMVGP